MAKVCKRRGRYVLDFYDQHGERQRLTMPEGTTKKEADSELDAYKDQVRKGTYVSDKKVPLFTEVAKDWIEYKRPKLRETTWEVYEGHVRNHFHDLEGLKVNRITITVIEKYITTRQLEGMALGTLRKILVTLGQILSYAVRHKYLDHNPLKQAKRPRGQGQEQKNDSPGSENLRVLTPCQITDLLAHVNDPKYQPLFMLAIFSGARQGELLGLKWADVDWQNSQIHIQRTFNKGRFFPPKTKTSKRKIDLGPTVLTELKKWKLACPKNELDLIFPNKVGEPINYSNMVQRHFLPALRNANLPKVRFHDLRHSYASLMINQGENIKYIQSQLGHSSPTVTLNVYAHLMKPTNQEAACRLENAIFGPTGHKMVTKSEKGLQPIAVTPGICW
jgi:integrase